MNLCNFVADALNQQCALFADRHDCANADTEVSQVLFRLSRWENLEYAEEI